MAPDALLTEDCWDCEEEYVKVEVAGAVENECDTPCASLEGSEEAEKDSVEMPASVIPLPAFKVLLCDAVSCVEVEDIAGASVAPQAGVEHDTLETPPSAALSSTLGAPAIKWCK